MQRVKSKELTKRQKPSLASFTIIDQELYTRQHEKNKKISRNALFYGTVHMINNCEYFNIEIHYDLAST